MVDNVFFSSILPSIYSQFLFFFFPSFSDLFFDRKSENSFGKGVWGVLDSSLTSFLISFEKKRRKKRTSWRGFDGKNRNKFFFSLFLNFQTLVGLGNVIQSLIFSFRSRCACTPHLYIPSKNWEWWWWWCALPLAFVCLKHLPKKDLLLSDFQQSRLFISFLI